MLLAAYHAGNPRSRSSRRQGGGEFASDLVNDGDNHGPRTREAHSGHLRTDSGKRPMQRPVQDAAVQSGRLSMEPELQHFGRPQWPEIYQFGGAQHIVVGDEWSRIPPPHRIDQGKQADPHERRQVARVASGTGPVVADITEQARCYDIRASIEAGEQSGELRQS